MTVPTCVLFSKDAEVALGAENLSYQSYAVLCGDNAASGGGQKKDEEQACRRLLLLQALK